MIQVLANGLISASVICLMAAALYPIWLTRGVFHFAHAAIFAIAPYLVYAIGHAGGARFGAGILVGISTAALIGVIIDEAVYRSLDRKNPSTIVYFIASMGLSTVGINLLGLIFGDESRSYRFWDGETSYRFIGDVRLSLAQITIFGTANLMAFGMWAVLYWTTFGLDLRAISADPGLARAAGIDVDGVNRKAAAFGAGMAGAAGVLTACDTDMVPTMGLYPLMIGLVATIIGRNRFEIVIVSAVTFGAIRNIGPLIVPTQWQDSVVFASMILGLWCATPLKMRA
jgi:branched-subunit amino acid ABC-type transport system permease component